MRRTAFSFVLVVTAGLLVVACGATSPTVSPPTISPPTVNPSTVASPASPTSILPVPTGTEAVGARDLAPVADGFGLRAWYPATVGGGAEGAPYMSASAWDALGAETPVWVPVPTSRPSVLPRLRTTAGTDAEPSSAAAPRPVVLLMPGWWQPAASVTILAADLASHGFVVVTIDPPRGSEPAGNDAAALAGRQAARLAAVHAALTLLADPALANQIGSIDMLRIAVGGHSFGGTIAFDSSLREHAVAAVFDLDGGLGYIPGEGPVPVPALVVSSELGLPGETRPDPVELTLLRDSTHVTTVGLRGSGHCDLSDLPVVYQAGGSHPEPDFAWCFGSIGSKGPTSVALIVRRFLDGALGRSSSAPKAAELIKDIPEGYVDPLGLGH